jgi:hypothetical protein
VLATLKARIGRHDEPTKAFFDSIDPSATSRSDPPKSALWGKPEIEFFGS